MKRYLKIISLIFFVSLTFFILSAEAKEKVKLYFFHGDGCPHCEEENRFLEKLSEKYQNLEIVRYEVWYHERNQKLLEKVKKKMDIKSNGVPLTVIGSTPISGYTESYNNKIERAIHYYLEDNNYQDIVKKIKNGTYKEKKVQDLFSKSEQETDSKTTIKIPFIGKVNLKNVSVFVAAATIGLIDGLNPCAMWVLLFLISMLIGMKNRKRMWILGISFLITSALVYMVIMLSWLNIVVNITTSILLRNIIAVVAIVGAFINLNSFRKEKDSGCEIVDTKKRKRIFSKIKKFTTEKSFLLALFGVIGLAVSVNLIELACSAGLPLVFTQILALNQVKGISAFLYTFIYILFFLLDDLIIFIIAMVTTKVTGISTKYNKYSHLIGGVIMLFIGILLILKPEWLMFNFH
ncbi:MAG: hypothetical protein HFJ12_01200 [Bacilli bacterium]|nr:hypothetical protein [Bacilli bacterium]